MSRVEPSPLLAEIQRLRQDLDELRTGQFFGGASVLGFLNHSAGLNDFSSVVPAGSTKNYELTFTQDHAKPSIQQLALFYSIDQTDVMSFYVPPWANGADIILSYQKLIPTDTESRWYIHAENTEITDMTLYLKVFFTGTDTGSWNIVEI